MNINVAGLRRTWRYGASRQSRGLVIAGALITFAFIVLAIFAPFFAHFDPTLITGDFRQAPSAKHWFGTSKLGFDIWSQSVWGARIALQVVLASTLFAIVVAVPLGLFSGYWGGRVDRVLVLVMDSIYAFPGLLLAIVIQSVFRPATIAASLDARVAAASGVAHFALAVLLDPLAWLLRDLATTPILGVAFAISVVYIPQYFRVIRNHVVSVKSETYVEAAQAIGAPGRVVVFRYIFFNVVSSVPVILTLNAADAILTLAGLGFLGYGLPPPTPEWGYNLSRAADEITFAPPIWWTSVFPGLMIVMLVLGITLLGEGLNDVFNPLLKEKAG
ncbi:MAG: ABC transporter permease [Thermoplasmatota archaeon]